MLLLVNFKLFRSVAHYSLAKEVIVEKQSQANPGDWPDSNRRI
jgi:hypothetical protein